MAKRRYRARDVKDVNVAQVSEQVGDHVTVAIDVAKSKFFATIQDLRANVVETVKWIHPVETEDFLSLVEELAQNASRVEAVMEPSGTYGDGLRRALQLRGLEVFRVNPKRTHDAKEVYDGVPSLHDAKSAAIIGKLHLDGCSEPWPEKSVEERRIAAALRVLAIDSKEFSRNRNRLENLLARHWPELPRILDLGSATLLELLIGFGSPERVADKPERATELMKRVGGSYLAIEKIKAVVASALRTHGVPMLEEERELVQEVAKRARQAQKQLKASKKRIEKLTKDCDATKHMAPTLGATTAAIVAAGLGNPANYKSATAYLKSSGLNVREKSSGESAGGLHITKRGPGVVRYYLFLAALRLIQRDPIVAAWYAKKVKRDGGKAKLKAVVAIMRKLVLALWHVGQGEPFDASKLFDATRLKVRVVQLEAA